MQKNQIKFDLIQMPPQNTNSVVLSVDDMCVVFDPWGRAQDWKNYFAENKLKPLALYATHGHPDHISSAPDLARHYDIDWYMSHRDMDLIDWGNGLLSHFGLPQITGDYKRPLDLSVGQFEILPNVWAEIIPLPGHTLGGVGYYFAQFGVLIVGDTLFQKSYGRTDLPGGNPDTLFQSISKIRNMHLPDATSVVHGHGHHTTIGWLKQNNPYFK